MAPTFEEYQKLLGETRQDIGRRYADLPQREADLRKEVFGQDKLIPALKQQQDAAIMELWETDKMLADRYANPESEMFIRDPYERESLVAGRHQNIFKGLAQSMGAEERQRDILGDILERGVKVFELGLTAKEKEFDMLNTEFQNALKLADMQAKQTEKATEKKKEEDVQKYLGLILQDTGKIPGQEKDAVDILAESLGVSRAEAERIYRQRTVEGVMKTRPDLAEDLSSLFKIGLIPEKQKADIPPQYIIESGLWKPITEGRQPTTQEMEAAQKYLQSKGVTLEDILNYIPKAGGTTQQKPLKFEETPLGQKTQLKTQLREDIERYVLEMTPEQLLTELQGYYPELSEEEIRKEIEKYAK